MNSITLAAFERAALCPPVPSGKLHLTEPEDLYPGTEQQASSDEKERGVVAVSSFKEL